MGWRRILERCGDQLGAHRTLPLPPFHFTSPKPRSIFHIITVWYSLPHSSENFLANVRFLREWEGGKTSWVDLQVVREASGKGPLSERHERVKTAKNYNQKGEGKQSKQMQSPLHSLHGDTLGFGNREISLLWKTKGWSFTILSFPLCGLFLFEPGFTVRFLISYIYLKCFYFIWRKWRKVGVKI